MTLRQIAIALAIAAAAGAAHSHGNKPHDPSSKPAAKTGPAANEETVFGRPGDPTKATRTIVVKMSDDMRFSPDHLTIRRGETIRFVVRNDGRVLHELVLGTKPELEKHAELMRRFPEMEHDEPYMAHVDPGRTGEVVWQFTNAGEFYYGCLIPGHYEAGMVGKVLVK